MARPPVAFPLLALAAFLALFGLVISGWAPLDDVNTAISDAFRSYGDQRPDLVTVLRIVTDVAATTPFLIAGAAVSLGLLARGERREAACCAVVTVLVPVLWSLQHWLVYHPRPVGGFVLATSNGFPSGHTSNATAAGLVAVLLLWPRLARTGRVVAVVLAAAFAVFIGVTRVALLAHWPVDVLGGWLLALAVVPLAVYAVDRVVSEPAAALIAKDPARPARPNP